MTDWIPQEIRRNGRSISRGSVHPQNYSKRSQDLPVVLHDTAHFIWGGINTFLEKKIVFDSYSCPIIIPNWRVCDIDTEEDWERAELMWKSYYLQGNT